MFNNPTEDAIDAGIIYLIRTLLSYLKIKNGLDPIHQDMLITLIENPRWRTIIAQKHGIAPAHVSARVGEAIFCIIQQMNSTLEKGNSPKTATVVPPPFVVDIDRVNKRIRAIQIGKTLLETVSEKNTRTNRQLQEIAESGGIWHSHFTYEQLVTIPMTQIEQYCSKHVIKKIDKILEKKNLCLEMSKETTDAYIAFAKKS